ncbi:MAG TPA: ABC transporter substrate-binding protein [Acidimicrobiales bacterium]|nr:ABC transporter substrate-binding protein [Acidimicrobiales bacterium]
MRRRRPARGAALCCLLLALTAGAASGAAALTVGPRGHLSAGRSGGHLTVVTVQAGGSWVGMDPFAPALAPGTAALFPVYDALFNVDPVTNAIRTNALATGYRIGDGGRTITISLRRNVKFQDGTPFDAQAVVWNLERSMSPAVASQCEPDLQVVSKVVASGPYQVALHLSSRDAGLLALLATQPCALMVSPTAYLSEGANFAEDPVGTGPFAYAGGLPGTVADFTRFDGYWGGRPKLGEITVEAVESDGAAYATLHSGAAQAWLSSADTAAAPDILEARHDPALVVTSGRAPSITHVDFAFTHSPFDNPVVRQVVTAATDAKTIDLTLYHNLFRPIEGVFPPSSWAYSGGTEKNYPAYDPRQVASLLAKLGSVSFTMLVADTPAQLQLAEALQAQWQSVGIDAQISPVAPSVLLSDLHTLNYQAALTTSPALPDPDDMVYPWFYSSSPFTENGMNSPAVDQYIRTGRADYGSSARRASYLKLNSLLSGLAPWDDIAAMSPYNIVAKAVKGIPVDPYSRFPWQSISLG